MKKSKTQKLQYFLSWDYTHGKKTFDKIKRIIDILQLSGTQMQNLPRK